MQSRNSVVLFSWCLAYPQVSQMNVALKIHQLTEEEGEEENVL